MRRCRTGAKAEMILENAVRKSNVHANGLVSSLVTETGETRANIQRACPHFVHLLSFEKHNYHHRTSVPTLLQTNGKTEFKKSMQGNLVKVLIKVKVIAYADDSCLIC